jgi:hypothetical protein
MDLQIEEDCREEELEVFLFQPRAKPPRTKSHSEIMNDANMFLNLFSHHVQCDVNIFRDLVSAKKGFIFKNPSKKQHFKSLGRSTALLKIVNVTSFVTKDTSLGSLDITSFVMKDTILVCLGTLEIDICSFAMKLTILGFLGTAGIATSLAMKDTILLGFLGTARIVTSLAMKHTILGFLGTAGIVTSLAIKDTILGFLGTAGIVTSLAMKRTILGCLGSTLGIVTSLAMKYTILGFLGTAGIVTSLAMKHTILGSLGATGFAFLWSFRCLGSLAALNYKHTSATNVNLAARRTRRFPLSIVSRYTCGEEGKESK